MKRNFVLGSLFLCASWGMAQQVASVDSVASAETEVMLISEVAEEITSDVAADITSEVTVNKYEILLEQMVAEHAATVENISADEVDHVNPLYYRLFAPLTFYKSPASQALSMDVNSVGTLEDSLRLANMTSGKDLDLLNDLDRVLLSTYLASPALVELTEDELMASVNHSEKAIKMVSESATLEVPTAIEASLPEATPQAMLDIVVQKPNFWVTKGSFSTQLTESFFSPNWYQGGINNLNLLSMLTLEANYNNKRKVQWDNKLDARLGFYQNQGEDGKMEDLQSNQDLLRLTSKLNLKAIRNWNYAIEAQGNTQMLNHYDESGDEKVLKSKFLTPADASFTVGMDYKKTFEKGSLSVFPGPISYKLNYVLDKELAESYGIEEGKHARHDLGSKIEVNFDYQITKNISYKTRFYYFTAPKKDETKRWYNQADWENTLNFQVSKYLSTKLFFHTRFDDLVEVKEEHANWGFFQFKQYLMLGFNYAW